MGAYVSVGQCIDCVCLTQAAELADDGREGVVHHTLQLAADAIRELTTAEVTGLDVPLHQRHGEASHPHDLQGNTDKKKALFEAYWYRGQIDTRCWQTSAVPECK